MSCPSPRTQPYQIHADETYKDEQTPVAEPAALAGPAAQAYLHGRIVNAGLPMQAAPRIRTAHHQHNLKRQTVAVHAIFAIRSLSSYYDAVQPARSGLLHVKSVETADKTSMSASK